MPLVGDFPLSFHGTGIEYPKWGTDNDYHVPLGPLPEPFSESLSMPRPMNDDLYTRWKLVVPATLAGKIEFMLTDPVHQKPIYGTRTKLITALLEEWIAKQRQAEVLPPVPSLAELRAMGEH